MALLSQQQSDRAYFEEVATRAGLDFQHFNTPVQCVDDLARDPAAIVIADASSAQLYSAFENCVSDKLGLYSALVNPNNYFFVGSQPLHQLTYLHNSQIFGSYLQRNYNADDQDFMGALFQRFSAESAFAVEKYFSPLAKQQVTKIKKSSEKANIVEALKEYLIRWGMNSRATGLIANAADELLMNAIYAAPADALGKPLHGNTPRNTPLDMDSEHEIEFKLVHDENRIAFSVTDLYGSLDRSKLMQFIAKSYRAEDYKVKTNVPGAGLGMGEVFAHSGGMLYSWEPGVRTEAMVFYRKSHSFKEFREQFRFLSTFAVSM